MALTPSVEIGIRQDGGDAETGRGIDLGGGLVVQDPNSGLQIDLRMRTLLVHEAEGFTERGISIAVGWNPTPQTPLGFSANITPAWGTNTQSGADAMWNQDTIGGMGHHAMLGGNRLDADLG